MCPVVVFKKLSLEENIEIVKSFYEFGNKDNNIYFSQNESIFNTFPALREIINDSMTVEGINKAIDEEVTRTYNEESFAIDTKIIDYNQYWSIYNNAFMETISNVLNVDWPSSLTTITAYVGILPICPRDLDNYNFYISWRSDIASVISNVIHETCHFLFFEKWKKLHRYYKRIEFDYPYPIWEYSEMVIDPILNRLDIKIVFKDMPGMNYSSYDYFYQDEKKDLMDKLRNIYRTEDIDDAIKNGYRLLLQSK